MTNNHVWQPPAGFSGSHVQVSSSMVLNLVPGETIYFPTMVPLQNCRYTPKAFRRAAQNGVETTSDLVEENLRDVERGADGDGDIVGERPPRRRRLE